MIKWIKSLFAAAPAMDYAALRNRGAVVIDVRTPTEFQLGHLAGSINYPLQTLHQQIQKLKQKNIPVITVCRSGMRSKTGCQMLKDHGIEAYNGGAWNRLQTVLNRPIQENYVTK